MQQILTRVDYDHLSHSGVNCGSIARALHERN
jgi:hypothetical protein